MDEDITSHEKREQKREERQQAEQQKESEAELKQRNKNYISIGLTILVLVAFASGVWYLMTHKKQMYTDRPIHWHALLDINICGEKRDVRGGQVTGTMDSNAMYGPHLLHHHNDNTIHIEGQVIKKEDIALGKFFDGIDIPFDKDKIMDKKNGDLCPDGKPGVLKMYVNGQPRQDFREYIPFATEDAGKQIIKLVFEPAESMEANTSATNASS